MPTTFYFWFCSLALSIFFAVVYRKGATNGQATLIGLFFVVFALSTLAGLWQAWSPWELTKR